MPVWSGPAQPAQHWPPLSVLAQEVGQGRALAGVEVGPAEHPATANMSNEHDKSAAGVTGSETVSLWLR